MNEAEKKDTTLIYALDLLNIHDLGRAAIGIALP